MPDNVDQVQPGDVISSDLFNFILQKLAELEERIDGANGGAGGQHVRIDALVPSVEQAVGQVLEIRGENFLFPPADNNVRIGATEIDDFLVSTTTALRFVIPELAGVPGNFVVSVSNEDFGSTSVLYRIIEGALPPGERPTIDSGGVTHEASGASILVVDEGIVIRGENFADPPSANRIVLYSLVPGFIGGVDESGDRFGDVHDVTDIDVGRSNEDELFATLPDFPIRSAAQLDDYRLSLEVGAHPPAEATVRITN